MLMQRFFSFLIMPHLVGHYTPLCDAYTSVYMVYYSFYEDVTCCTATLVRTSTELCVGPGWRTGNQGMESDLET